MKLVNTVLILGMFGYNLLVGGTSRYYVRNANLTWNTDVPDFTECFQQVVFVLIPYSVFCAIGVANLWLNSKRPVDTAYSWTVLCILKMILCIALILISILEMIFLPQRKLLETNVRDIIIASSCVQIIAYIIILIFLKQNACRKVQRAAMFLTIFWFIFSICNAFRYRSSFIRAFNVAFASTPADGYILNMVQFPLIICQLFFSLFSDPVSKVKQSFLEDSSFFSIFTFFWFNKYIYKSRKRVLTLEDIQPLSPKLQASGLYEKFQTQWTKALHRRSQSGEESKGSALFLAYILTKATWPYFVVGCVMQLAYDFLIFLPPILLDKTLAFVIGNDYAWKGYFYCGSLFLSGFCTQSGFTFLLFFSALYGFQVKSIVISAIYHKAIKLSSFARRNYTVGEMVNLMSVDADNLYMMAIYSNLLFGAPLKLIITIVMLWQYLGPSCLAGGVVLILMMLGGYFVQMKTKIVQEKQMNMKDSRLKHLNETLNGIKVLKLYAWETPFMDKISLIRNKEVNFIRIFQLLFAGSVFLWNCGPFLIGLASLVTYVLVDEKHILDAKIVFVSINLLKIFQHVVQELPDMIAKVAQARVTLTRVMNFLIAEERKRDEIGKSCIAGEAITVQKGVFSWSNDGEPNLSDINFHVPTGSLIAVTGPVGAGKSSLLSALLGEMVKRSGSIDINGTIAYVPQQAWILNRSVRDNILFVNKMNKNRYDAILDNCCLRPDLEILPGGDKTEIGEKGVNLSGGQKQRVSLARAIFHDADIYLLDDPLSALDSHVGKHIFEHVIGKSGILKDKTRVLVTHNINVLPETDFIVTMKEGKIHEAGTYNQLLESGGVFADFIMEHSTVKEIDEDSEEKMYESSGDLKIEHKKSINDDGALARSISVDSTKSTANAKLVEEEGMEVGEVKRAIYINYAKHLGILLLFGMLSGYFVAVALSISIDVWLSSWSGDPVLDDGTQDIGKRNYRITIYAVLGICKAVVKAAAGVCLAFGSARAARIYHKEMLQSILKAPMSFFDTTPLGRMVNRFGRDIDDVDTQMSIQLDSYVACVFYALGTIIVISSSTPLFLAFLLPLLVLYYIIQKCYLKTSRQLKRLYAITRSPIYSHFSETVNGTSSVRAYRVEDHFIKTADEKLNANITCQLFFFMCCRWLEFHLGLIGNLIVLIAAILAVESRGVLEAGVIGLSITYALTIVDDLTWIVYSGTELENKFVSVERIEEYSNLPSEAPWIVSKSFPPPTWPTQGKLEFKGYSTRYREGLDLVIKNIDLNIGENEKVGIVGRTGAGKSSFALALFRIIEPAGGAAFIDDIDVSQIGLHQLRSKLTIIPQDPVLFTGPLRMNLDPNDAYSDDEIWSSLESAHLKNFVSSLAEGLNYEIAEGGENLSVGQRQLLCLARALLKQAKILILDEATAAVDMETDRLIQNTIRSEFKEYTVITIAHRLNTIMDYDKVVVMDSGEIVEVGNPAELTQRPNSHFYNMAKDAGLL